MKQLYLYLMLLKALYKRDVNNNMSFRKTFKGYSIIVCILNFWRALSLLRCQKSNPGFDY